MDDKKYLHQVDVGGKCRIMYYEFREDWNEVKKRYTAWWNRENTDRPLFHMCVHDNKNHTVNTLDDDYEDKWTNIEGILDREESRIRGSFFPAEGFPAVSAFLGPGSLATFLGSEPKFAADTVWYEQCFSDIRNACAALNRDSKWWKWTVGFTERAVERSKGRYIVEMPDLIENFDILASLLGTENLMYDMYDYPQEIHRLQRELLDAWFEAFDALYRLIGDEDGGMSYGGFGIWAPGSFSKLQCDFSAMISADMFGEFVVPYLKKQSDRLDYSIYHLDGPNALQHFDQILSIKSIKAIQWQPGAATGAPVASDPCWDPIYRKILDSGKSILTLLRVDTEEAVRNLEAFIKRNGKKGVLVLTEPHPTSLKQACDIIDRSYNW